jgi:DnaJ like chaperone protein
VLSLLSHRSYKRAICGRLNGTAPDIDVPAAGKTQQLLTQAMFAMMGKLAKLDGRVTELEVKYATSIMQRMGLTPPQRQRAIDYFYQGKQPTIDVMPLLKELVGVIGSRSALAHAFLKTQCGLACAKGDIRLKEKMLLRDIAEELGFDKAALLAVCTDILGASDGRQLKARNFLSHAYKVLQLEPGVDDGEIRKAYLRLMSRYHPDKLVRQNLTEENLKQAQEKFSDIRSAYETVCGFRKIRA